MKLKLLIITQKVDINDDILGFFHDWLKEFARHCELVTVICLQKGEYDLPRNVKVLSLGKERGASRLKYIFNFYKYIWRERKNYDAVFVHMNQEYMILGGLFWKLWRKKIMFWRNHPVGNFLTRIAIALSDKIFCTSKYSFTARSKKTTLMPVGIDTEKFKKIPTDKIKNSILFLARVAPVKKQDLLVEALNILKKDGVDFSAGFYGNCLPKDTEYMELLKEKVKKYGLEKNICFYSGVSNSKTPEIYNKYEIFVNTSPSGMYDKTIFEAMACESLILTSNANLIGEIDNVFLFAKNDVNDLAIKLKCFLALDIEMKEKYGKMLRKYVEERHDLERLARELENHFMAYYE